MEWNKSYIGSPSQVTSSKNCYKSLNEMTTVTLESLKFLYSSISKITKQAE